MHFATQLLVVVGPILPLVTAALGAPSVSHDIDSRDRDLGTHMDWQARNLKTIQSLYNLSIYPNNMPIIEKGAVAVPPGIFDANAGGRVTPIGNFSGFDLTIEYFFALGPTGTGPLKAAWTNANIVEFSSGCAEVAASVVYLDTTVVDPGQPDHGKLVTTFKQITFWRFNEAGEIIYFDVFNPSLAFIFSLSSGVDFSRPAVQAQEISALCQNTQTRCTGPNQQYASVDECISFMSNIPFGSYDEIWADNVVCRTLHYKLTLVRPDVSIPHPILLRELTFKVHCPHVGPTGGMKCVDIDFNTYYYNDQDVYGSPRGETFQCPRN